MPIDETPLAQLVLAVARKWTGEEVLLLVGAETETVPNADVANMRRHKKSFMRLQLSIRIVWRKCAGRESAVSGATQQHRREL
jgi:hypothetical protein